MKRKIRDIHDIAAEQRVSVRRMMDFTDSVNPLGPASAARSALRKSVRMLARPVDDGARYLTRAIARASDVPGENVLVSGGIEELFAAIVRSLDLKTLLVCSPYPSYYRKVLEYPVDFHFLELKENDRFNLDPEAWEKALTRCDAAIVPYPSFISERSLARDDLARMITLAKGRGTRLIIDETLLGYADAAPAARDITGEPQCLIISSMTEYYALPGLPVAYCIGDTATLRSIRQSSPVNPPSTPAAAAATASLQDRDYPRRTRSYIAQERVFIEGNLRKIPGISFYGTSCGSFVVQCEQARSGMDVFSRYNIIVDEISGSLFFPVKDHKWNARYLKTLKNIVGGSHQ